jgi:hypothetical protein
MFIPTFGPSLPTSGTQPDPIYPESKIRFIHPERLLLTLVVIDTGLLHRVLKVLSLSVLLILENREQNRELEIRKLESLEAAASGRLGASISNRFSY